MSHLESLIIEYLDWQQYFVRRNVRVGRLSHGGWEMELDIVGYNPSNGDLVHYEPSLDAHSWKRRSERYAQKFGAAKKYMFCEVLPWLDSQTKIRQIAIFGSRPKHINEIEGGQVMSVDEFVAEVRNKVMSEGIASRRAISESYPLLRTMQLTHCGYYRVR